MGANASNYPHSCSPRVGGNSQAQQTFIGNFQILFSIMTVNRIVFSMIFVDKNRIEPGKIIIDNGSVASRFLPTAKSKSGLMSFIINKLLYNTVDPFFGCINHS
jgi:hypothetical protein